MARGHDDQGHGIHALRLQLGHHRPDISSTGFGHDVQDIVNFGLG